MSTTFINYHQKKVSGVDFSDFYILECTDVYCYGFLHRKLGAFVFVQIFCCCVNDLSGVIIWFLFSIFKNGIDLMKALHGLMLRSNHDRSCIVFLSY